VCVRARVCLSLSLSLARSKNFNPHIQQLRNATTKSSGACSWRWEFMTIYLRVRLCFCVLCFVSLLGLCCRGWIFARHSTLHTSTEAAQQHQQVENPETKTAEYNFFQLLAQKWNQNSRRLLSTVLTCVNIKSKVSTTQKD
jgi:hypothetical protein